MMQNVNVKGKTLDEERALYGLRDACVTDCTFAGPADGESALKETENVRVEHCRFALRYPFWHMKNFRISDCTLADTTRAPLWYAENGSVEKTEILGVKCLRECRAVSFDNDTIVSSEFGWRCRDIRIENCNITSEYFLFETQNGTMAKTAMRGKYSFQYAENWLIENCDLDTKDAFWHAKNVTVRNCRIKGEYLGWYSEGLTLINCHIAGTQPLCYCKALTLENCTMEGADLAFEYSDVQADVRGEILSVKNPRSGCITADSIGAIIRGDAVIPTDCRIEIR